MIKMTIAIFLNMKYFLLILLLAIMGFANVFYIIARNAAEPFAGNNIFYAFIYSYGQGMGDFSTDGYDIRDELLIYIIWFIHTLVTMLILLNLLIAIMGDTFDQVQETSDQNILKDLAGIMVENEILLNRNLVFKNQKYIIVI